MNNPKDDPAYLRIADAARFLGVNPRTIYRRVWSGELPAARVGGLYFIRKTDLEALLNKPSKAEADRPEPEGALRCGRCYRVLSSDSLIGQACAQEGCSEILCVNCVAEGAHYCAVHAPTPDQRWNQAEERYKRGETAVLVKSTTARLREINFLNRIKNRLLSISTLIHPQSGEVVLIKSWDDCIEEGDDRLEVMRRLGKVVLDTDSLARLPQNAHIACHLPLAKNVRGGAIEIQVNALSRLDDMVNDGFDTRPLGVEELLPWLAHLSEQADREKMTLLVSLASTTGWDAAAREVIQGRRNALGGAFTHRLMLIYLFDLETGDLIYNTGDERARKYAELFVPLTPSEELDEATRAVERELGMFDSLTLAHAAQVLPYPPQVIKSAFERLVRSGRFDIIEMPDLGTTLVRQTLNPQ
jgi:excisionase family DNA binding protein